MRAIKKVNLSYPVARHFLARHNSDATLLKFCAIQRILPFPRGCDRIQKLREHESKFIIDWQTKTPGGLNQDEELYVHLHV